MAPTRPSVTEEDLDDLDDLVTGDPTPPIKSSSDPSTTTPVAALTSAAAGGDDFPDPDEAPLDDAALAAELQKGLSSLFEGLDEGDEGEFKQMMERLMRGEPLPGGAAMGSEAGENEPSEDELMSQLMAAMGAGGGGLAGLGAGAASAGASTGAGAGAGGSKGKAKEATTTSGAAPPANFQDAIKASLSKVKESNSTIDQETSAKTAAGASGDPFAAMMAQMAGLEGGEEGLQGMLDEMMGQLMSRDVLYEPLKELSDKYPTFLAENESKLSAEDLSRFRIQSDVVAQIVAKFEEPGAGKPEDQMSAAEKDCNTERQQEITDLIAKMNDCGAPPKDIMGEMPPGMELGADGVPKMPEDCTIM